MFYRTLTRQRVIVNLKGGDALRGILLAQRGPLLFLADAEYRHAGNPSVPVDGQAVIERPNVEWIQIVPGE